MRFWRYGVFLAVVVVFSSGWLFLWPRSAHTQQARDAQRTPTIEEYQPKSTLITKEHKIERAKYPFIDIHSHHWNPTPEHVDELIKGMDSINLRLLVNLSGGTGEQLRQTVATMKGRYAERFVVFANMSYDDLNAPGFGKRVAERLEQDVKNGAARVEDFQELWDGPEICQRRACARGRSGIRRDF